jgi:hypothetical protein
VKADASLRTAHGGDELMRTFDVDGNGRQPSQFEAPLPCLWATPETVPVRSANVKSLPRKVADVRRATGFVLVGAAQGGLAQKYVVLA